MMEREQQSRTALHILGKIEKKKDFKNHRYNIKKCRLGLRETQF